MARLRHFVIQGTAKPDSYTATGGGGSEYKSPPRDEPRAAHGERLAREAAKAGEEAKKHPEKPAQGVTFVPIVVMSDPGIKLLLDSLEDKRLGSEVERSRFSLSQDNDRFFGTLDLSTPVSDGVALSVGVRNSVDKTFPLGFCAGSRVFICDNLAFRAELLVARKHTVNGGTRFREAIALAVQSLGLFRDGEAQRIGAMRAFPLTDRHAESLILQAYERDIISHRVLPGVIAAWRKPPHPEFQEPTLWSLMNAFTGAIQGRATTNPQQFALQTIRLHALLSPSEN